MIGAVLMKRSTRIALIVVLAAFAVVGCARMPKPERSVNVIKRHFKKYGKRYPTTVYGREKVEEVEITGQEEIHRNLVAVESFITLGNGDVQRIYATLEKGPFGWRFVSWELATR